MYSFSNSFHTHVTDSEKHMDRLWYRISYGTRKDSIYIYYEGAVMFEDKATPRERPLQRQCHRIVSGSSPSAVR